MKKILGIYLLAILFISCSDDSNTVDSTPLNITFKFTHNWDGETVTDDDLGNFQFVTEHGETISIERLRYLISDVTFTTTVGERLAIDNYHLVDISIEDENENLSFSFNPPIPYGSYSNVSFTFGFDNEDNAENYLDLNSASFNVPDMLGGGYHYMQFDGKYLDSESNEQNFNYHAIRAVDNPGDNPTFPQDTFFTVNLGAMNLVGSAEVEVEVNLAQWFKGPHIWDLNTLNTVLMPNSSAQIMMYDNGQNVFSLGEVID